MRRAVLMTAVLGLVWLAGCGSAADREAAAPPETGQDEYVNSIFREQFEEFRVAAEQGDAEGQKGLGMMYYLGQGVERDFGKAYEWLKKAADQGEPVAQMTLGVMYSEGQGVPQDYVRAHVWLSLSAAQGTTGVDKRLAALESKMTAEQLAEAERLAGQWGSGA